MESVTKIMLELIGSEICSKPLNLSLSQPYSEKTLYDLYTLAKRHGVVNIVASALINNGLLEGNSLKSYFENELYSAVFVYEKTNSTYEKISELFENEKIPYIPLKGTVIKNLYPHKWLRSSCDIDILIKKDDVKKAIEKITSVLGYSVLAEGQHDVTVKTSDGILTELHFSLLGNSKSSIYSSAVDDVWSYAVPLQNYCYRFSDAMFYYYQILHMAKHFRLGGCGVRPFLDLWLINKEKDYNTPEVENLLKEGKLWEFHKSAKRLSAVWFSDEAYDETTLLMEEFILNGGSFGSRETRLITEHQRSGGKLKYVLSRLFVPYDYLKVQYPVLKKYPIFTPFCEICRLLSLLFGKKRNLRKSQLKNVNNVSSKHVYDINLLFERVGLD